MGAKKELEYSVDGKVVKFTIRRITYGEYQKIIAGFSQVELIGGNATRSKVDTTRLVDEIMKISVSGDTDYHDLDVSDGIDLQREVLEINGMGDTPSFRPNATG